MLEPRDRVIVALDFATVDEARACVAKLDGTLTTYKIGLELLFAGGLDLVHELVASKARVFVDAKFLDIGNTVEKAVANVARLGGTFLTIHALDRKTMEAAVRGRGDSALKLLGVTVMTNLDDADLADQGISVPTSDLVLRRAEMAKACGLDGVIASGHEAAAVRTAVGPDFHIITPGIRPSGADVGDQTRVMTPARAIEAGADHLVVGRPITQAPAPEQAATQIVAEVAAAI